MQPLGRVWVGQLVLPLPQRRGVHTYKEPATTAEILQPCHSSSMQPQQHNSSSSNVTSRPHSLQRSRCWITCRA